MYQRILYFFEKLKNENKKLCLKHSDEKVPCTVDAHPQAYALVPVKTLFNAPSGRKMQQIAVVIFSFLKDIQFAPKHADSNQLLHPRIVDAFAHARLYGAHTSVELHRDEKQRIITQRVSAEQPRILFNGVLHNPIG